MPITRERRLHVFSVKGRWYWWLVASNGRTLACSPVEGFTRHGNALDAAITALRVKYVVVYSAPEQLSVSADHQLFQHQNRSLGDLLLAATGKRPSQ